MRIITSILKGVGRLLKWTVILVVGLIAVGAGLALLDDDNPESMITITSNPENAEVTVRWHRIWDRERTGKTPFDAGIPEGTEVEYSIAEDGALRLAASEGTFIAPPSGETISIRVERLSEEEATAVRAREIQEELDNKLSEVAVACQSLVRQQLNAPSTAEFAGILSGREVYRVDSETGFAYYASTVDAQNSFGAMIRSSFACSYSLQDNTVTLISLE